MTSGTEDAHLCADFGRDESAFYFVLGYELLVLTFSAAAHRCSLLFLIFWSFRTSPCAVSLSPASILTHALHAHTLPQHQRSHGNLEMRLLFFLGGVGVYCIRRLIEPPTPLVVVAKVKDKIQNRRKTKKKKNNKQQHNNLPEQMPGTLSRLHI